jgi:tetratricopeptide (TPR) repeat protein
MKKLAALLLFLLAAVVAEAQVKARTLTIVTEPRATVWIDDVSYGRTGADGRLTLRTFATGTHRLRVRANGFREAAQTLTAARRGEIRVALVETTDAAEIAFQKAESETGDRERQVGLYEEAIRLRPNFPEAYIGLARTLAEIEELEGAHEAIAKARKYRSGYATASAVEGRLFKDEGEDEKAIASFRRAIREGKGFQPEAHTGLGLIFKDQAGAFAASGDADSEDEYHRLAAAELRKAATQLVGAPDALVIYQLLGDCYERAKMWDEAIAAYREVIELFPDANEVTMFRSLITQIEKRKAEQ